MTQIEGVTLASRSDWTVLRPLLFESIGQTLEMVLVTMIVGGILGLVLGVVLYGTRPGNLFENAVVYRILDVIVNIIRPIPFIIFLAAMQPLTIKVIGTSIGTAAAIFPMIIMCTTCRPWPDTSAAAVLVISPSPTDTRNSTRL